jgi:predicted nuclease of predicted toxin-antitoxin system
VRVLLDTCVWGGALADLSQLGHDAIWAGDWPDDPGDAEILSRAYRDDRTLVTLDKDFGELAIVHGMLHRGIVRLVGVPARRQGNLCHTALARYETELRAGAIVTLEQGRVRIRSPET